MEIGHVINVGPEQYQGRRVLQPGEVIETWCRHHGNNGKRTRHLYQSPDYPALVCLECHPEKDPEVQR